MPKDTRTYWYNYADIDNLLQNKSNNNENTIEIARGSFTLPFEKQEDFQYMSETNNIDENQRANLGLESNTGDNCCTEFNKICLLF